MDSSEMTSEVNFVEEPTAHTQTEKTESEAGQAGLVLGDRHDLHLGDYVGFERITPSRDWRLSLGKVVGFPTSRTVKVAHYDPIDEETTATDPASEEELRKRAEAEGKLELWQRREELHEELKAAVVEERAATQRLFTARDLTLQKQATVAEQTSMALQSLEDARRRLEGVPLRQWRDLRTPMAPPPGIVNVIRATMLVLSEDKAKTWESMQVVMRQPNFMDRLLSWDCTANPMSLKRRQKLVKLCAVQPLSPQKKKRASTVSASEPFDYTVPASGVDTGAMALLDGALRNWLNAQLACSEGAESQIRTVDECFAEQQQQRVMLREVNDMRANISSREVRMLEAKNAILGIDNTPKPLKPVDQYEVASTFHKRTYPDSEGRFVQEVILRDMVLVNFGPMAGEDQEGYVHLDKSKTDVLRLAMRQSYVHHDADEMEDLLARKDREEAEIASLRARIAELQAKDELTQEEEEELRQLERLLEDAERRHKITLERVAELYACGRGAREITMASKKPEFKYTRLHCKMAGDWHDILEDPDRVAAMMVCLREDLSELLNVPRENIFDVDARAGSLLIDFTVKHSGELDDDELQDLVNNGDFSALCMFYEKVTFKKTSPLNKTGQEEDFKNRNFSGMGVKETLSDFYNSDGELEEDFSDEIKNDVDYRKACITIPPVRDDFDEYALTGPKELYEEGDEVPGAESPENAKPFGTLGQYSNVSATQGNQNAYGLTGTEHVFEEEDMPATESRRRGVRADGGYEDTDGIDFEEMPPSSVAFRTENDERTFDRAHGQAHTHDEATSPAEVEEEPSAAPEAAAAEEEESAAYPVEDPVPEPGAQSSSHHSSPKDQPHDEPAEAPRPSQHEEEPDEDIEVEVIQPGGAAEAEAVPAPANHSGASTPKASNA